jgi:predicted nucleotidyltransferase component of viral defense system
MYPQVITPQTSHVLNALKVNAKLSGFYLSGGTALALQLGHRVSEDLDFFSGQRFDPILLQEAIEKTGRLTSTELAENTLNTFFNDVKVQFLYYPYPMLENLLEWEGVKLSSLADIACTKMITVSMRGSKKDFVDIYFLLQRFTLEELFKLVNKKYRAVDYNPQHILKSLVYFEDAEGQPMPRMQTEIDWETIKAGLIRAVKTYKI